ncbi:hypothetical protein CAI21_22515 [Alkalilimnicola ehrlichii]|nr:hypothetical protein CAI21_22515 [Alkalilimnicola ehrlichii]
MTDRTASAAGLRWPAYRANVAARGRPRSDGMGILNRKKTAAPPPPPPKPPEPLALIATGVCTLAGTGDYAAQGAVQLKLNGAKPNPALALAVPDQGAPPVLTAALDKELLPPDTPVPERLVFLLAHALLALAKQLDRRYLTADTRLQVLLPSAASARGHAVKPQALKASVLQHAPAFAACDWHFSRDADGGVNALQQCLDGDWQQLIFVGVDSLIDAGTVLDFAYDNRAMRAGATQGIVPGEAAGAVALTRTPGEQPVRAWLRGWASEAEPAVGQAETESLPGLRTAIKTALQQADIAATDVQAVSHGLGAEIAGDLEWYQTHVAFWRGQRGPKQQRLHIAFGDVGVAALPLQLALIAAEYDSQRGLARYDFPAPGPVLVCDTPNAPVRGAVCLTPA